MRPPQQFNFGVWPRGPRLSIPTGLLAIGSYLKYHGIAVSIYDAFVEGSDFNGNSFTKDHYYKRAAARSRIVSRSLDQIESGSLPAVSSAAEPARTTHFGASWRQIETALSAINADAVGITNLFRENSAETMRLAALAKTVNPACVVIVGGPNANAQPQELMRSCAAIDLIGFGDGERVMLQLAEHLAGKTPLESIDNIMYRSESGELKRTTSVPGPMELDEYGPLDYGLIRLERYFSYERGGIMARNKFLYRGSERAVSMVTSRGCPYRCTFCSVNIHAGKKFRRHSVEYIVAQLENLTRIHGVRHVHFEDDNFALDKRRFIALLNEVISRGIHFTWDTPNGIFAENLDEDVLRLMKRSGCVYAIIGVESGDQWVLDNVIRKQPLKLTTVLRVFRAANQARLDLHAFYIIGFPQETLEHIERTLDFAYTALRKYDIIPHLSIARADPGTSLYQEAQQRNSLSSNFPIANAAGVRSDMFDRHLIRTENFTPELLEGKNERFHRQCIRHILLNRLYFLAGRPVDLFATAYELLRGIAGDKISSREALVKLFWCKLLYKNAIEDRGTQARFRRIMIRARNRGTVDRPLISAGDRGGQWAPKIGR